MSEKFCNQCRTTHSEDDCPTCGGAVSGAPDTVTAAQIEKDQYTEAELDEMVRRASVPNLADLFKKAKAAGIITAGKEYGDSA